ncbi:MAG TPA: acyltransferase [Opitutaceae bacterium]
MSVPAEAATAHPTRIAALDGLRGIAVLLVVVMHYYVVVPTPPDAPVHYTLRDAAALFHHGVDLFFVLSGFFIGGILLDYRESPRLLRAFYVRRALRILPLYALLLGSLYVGRQVSGLNALYGGRLFASVLPDWPYFAFLQNFWMTAKQDLGPHWLSVTWSLTIEEQFYLVLPFAILWLPRRSLILACAAGVLLGPVLRLLVLLQTQNSFATAVLLPTHADGLLCGLLCALVVRSPTTMATVRRQRRVFDQLLWLGAIILGASMAGLLPDLGQGLAATIAELSRLTLISLACAAVVLHVLAFPNSRLARCLALRSLVWVGLVSYFVYLFHRPVWYVLHWAIFDRTPAHLTLAAGGVTVLALGLTLLLAAASWRWLESPLLRFARQFPYR